MVQIISKDSSDELKENEGVCEMEIFSVSNNMHQ